MESLRQQSPIAGKPRTEQTSAHHRVTATSWRLAPRAQRIEVQDGASETMRNPVERFEMWPGAIIEQNSKDVTRQAGAEEKNARPSAFTNWHCASRSSSGKPVCAFRPAKKLLPAPATFLLSSAKNRKLRRCVSSSPCRLTVLPACVALCCAIHFK